jgi:hypothetical protein
VDPDFAEEKRAAHSERDGWKVRGKLIDWRERFARFWTEEKEAWLQKRKKNAARRGAASERPDGWKEGDQAWWWSDALTSVQAALGGASQLDDKKTAARLREIIGIRKGAK